MSDKEKSANQAEAEAEVEAFRQDLGPFVVAAETTRMAMVFTDATRENNPIVFVNDSFLKLTGYSRDEVLAESFDFLMAKCADREQLAEIEAAFAGHVQHESEAQYRRKDGSVFWAAIFISPVADDDGVVVQHFASFIDLTRHKEEQAQSRMLIDELNHRVKNTLASVQSIVTQALRNRTDPVAIKEAIESRLFALSRSHDLLTQEDWESAGLHDVVDAALEPFRSGGRAERFVVTGINIRFPPKAALALGIAFHELATNAMKYGAFSNERGHIRVDWTIETHETGPCLRLCWREIDGPPVAPPTRSGFGSRVIDRGLTHELGARVTLDFHPLGVVCTIEVPLPTGPIDE